MVLAFYLQNGKRYYMSEIVGNYFSDIGKDKILEDFRGCLFSRVIKNKSFRRWSFSQFPLKSAKPVRINTREN